MAQIIRVAPDRDLYLEWSSVVDAPIRVGTRAEFAEHLSQPRRGEVWLTPKQVEERLRRADETGASGFRPFGITWDHQGPMYQQQGILPRHRLAEYAERLLADVGAEPNGLQRAAWAAHILVAMDGRGLNVHAVARLSGVSPGALHAWLYSDVEPDPRALSPLAEVVGVSHVDQLELLGWLPVELQSAPLDRRGDWREHM